MSAPAAARAPAPRPAAGRAGSRNASRPRARVVIALAAALAAALGACAPAPPPIATPGTPAISPSPSPAAGTPAISPPPGSAAPTPAGGAAGSQLLLVAEASGAALYLLRSPGDVLTLPVPDPSTVAVAPMRDGSLVALRADGRGFVAGRGVTGLLEREPWRPLALAGSGAPRAGMAVSFGAAVSPDGSRLAAIELPPGRGGPGALVVVTPGQGRRAILPLAGESEGVPPAWIDDDRVAIVQRDRADRTFLAIVEVADGSVLDRIVLRALDFRTSGDAGTAAVVGDGDRVTVGPTSAVLERRAPPWDGPALAAGELLPGGMALDRDGRRLAVVVGGRDGRLARVGIYELADGTWRQARSVALPEGVGGGSLSWLP